MELSGVQFGVKPNAGFEITSMMMMNKIARREVRLPLYNIHFEISKFSRSDTGVLVCTNVLLI